LDACIKLDKFVKSSITLCAITSNDAHPAPSHAPFS
jgi:hypothetical protein